MKPLVTIKVRKGDIGRALKQFKRKVEESDHIKELKSRTQYLKPSVKKRKMMNDTIRRSKWEEKKHKDEL